MITTDTQKREKKSISMLELKWVVLVLLLFLIFLSFSPLYPLPHNEIIQMTRITSVSLYFSLSLSLFPASMWQETFSSSSFTKRGLVIVGFTEWSWFYCNFISCFYNLNGINLFIFSRITNFLSQISRITNWLFKILKVSFFSYLIYSLSCFS